MKKIILLCFCFVSASVQANRPPSTVIYDVKNDTVIAGSNLNVTRPIASLTKIMTALVALQHDTNLDRAVRTPSHSRLPAGTVTRRDLFSAMLVRSDNAAATALAADFPGGVKEFVKAMNRRARELGMTSTRFVDASGLSSGNIATIWDITIMLLRASREPDIAELSILPRVEYQRKNYTVVLENTNRFLLADHDQIRLSKTGYTRSAGWSVGMVLQHHGRRFVVVVLGAATKEERYRLATHLTTKQLALVEMVTNTVPELSVWRRAVDSIIDLRREDLP
jgi:D-alanyl-D-alanine endopeptidase (penicillin-binding protein 7)